MYIIKGKGSGKDPCGKLKTISCGSENKLKGHTSCEINLNHGRTKMLKPNDLVSSKMSWPKVSLKSVDVP